MGDKPQYLLHVVQAAHILTPHPVVQAFVKKSTGAVGMNASDYLIKNWLIPKHFVGQEKVEKEASMIHLFHQEFGMVVSLLVV